MKSAARGRTASRTEVTNVTPVGVWMLVLCNDELLSFESSPWFRSVSIEHICAVELPAGNHLYWPELDIDLAVASIDQPGQFPLASKVAQQGVAPVRA